MSQTAENQENEHPARNMIPPRLGPRDAIERFISTPITFLVDAVVRDKSVEARYTTAVLGLILWFFALEVALMLNYGAASTHDLVSYFFKFHPWLVWPIAPFLHRGVGHFAVNVLFIYIAAPVEDRLSKLQYLRLLFLAGFLPLYADGLKLVIFGQEPHVAAYGASGFVFGLLGYGLAAQMGNEWQLTPRQWLIVLGGVAGVIVVLKNGVLAMGDPVALHFGHLWGLLVGIGFGYHESRS